MCFRTHIIYFQFFVEVLLQIETSSIIKNLAETFLPNFLLQFFSRFNPFYDFQIKKHPFCIIRVTWSNSYSSVKIMFLFCVYWNLARMRPWVLRGAGKVIVCFCFMKFISWSEVTIWCLQKLVLYYFIKKLTSPQ